MGISPTVGRIIHVHMQSEDGKIVLGPLCARVVALRDRMVVMVDRPKDGSFTSECIALPYTPGEKQSFHTLVSVPSKGRWVDVFKPVVAYWEWPPRE